MFFSQHSKAYAAMDTTDGKRTTELADFVARVKQGRYIVIFAPRQTGKTTFFRWALDALAAEGITYFPIQLDFEAYKNLAAPVFYSELYKDIREEVEKVFQKRGHVPSEALHQYLEGTQVTDHLSMLRFFTELANLLKPQRVVIIIDEFDGIPRSVVSDFLYSLRRIYLAGSDHRCPYSLGIVGVKSITQLNYDRSISPFNIQDEFALPNFTFRQVQELLGQYTDAVGQPFAPEVIEALHKQTAGQPFLVNRFAQILTEELDVPKTDTIAMTHFSEAHTRLLRERNVNIQHLITNIRRNPRFETILMEIVSYDRSIEFNLDNEYIGELATYGVIAEGPDGVCEIVNPIYQYRIMKAFQPLINGLEREYFPEDAEIHFLDYLTSDEQIRLQPLLDNFQNFIARAGYRILQVPETPKEFVGNSTGNGHVPANFMPILNVIQNCLHRRQETTPYTGMLCFYDGAEIVIYDPESGTAFASDVGGLKGHVLRQAGTFSYRQRVEKLCHCLELVDVIGNSKLFDWLLRTTKAR